MMTDRMTDADIEAVCEWIKDGATSGLLGIDAALSAEKLQQALTAIRQLQQPWRGMESAPRDGTRVVVWKDGETYVAQWQDLGKCWGVNVKNGAYTSIGPSRFEGILLDVGPTAWMPLPAPPEQE